MQRVERERDVTLKNIRIFELILNNIFFRLIILDFEFQIFNIAIPILDKYDRIVFLGSRIVSLCIVAFVCDLAAHNGSLIRNNYVRDCPSTLVQSLT